METMSNTENTNITKNKKSVIETGHAKNIANFQDLISFCQGYGAIYNPSKESLKITEIQNLYQAALNKLYAVKTDKTGFDNAKNSRRIEFEDVKPFTTKILNAFIVSGADKFAIDDVKSINKKIKGVRASVEKAKTNEDSSIETPKTISTSQQSYDRLIDHFANLLQVLEQNTVYNPNESELKLDALQIKFQNMKTVNTNLIHSYTQYSNALIERNKILYDLLSGLVQIAKEIKLYIKSIFGATSPQYYQVSGLEFKTVKS